MTKNGDSSIKLDKYGINILNIFVALILLISTVLSGCDFSSRASDKAFKEEYEAAKKKYEKYYDKVVSGQEVLDLIDNWDETEFKLTVEDLEGERFKASNVDKDNTIFKYWDKESIYYIDPNALYKGGFILYQNPRIESDRGIVELYFSLVKDPTLPEENEE